MFLEKLETTLESHPEWREPLERIERAIARQSSPSIDPAFVSEATKLPLDTVLAFLQILSEHTAGRFRLRIVDSRGLEIGSFPNEREIPDTIENDFGDVTVVNPENVQLVFELTANP